MTRLDIAWWHVLFANWFVDPAHLNAYLPSALSIDSYDGNAWFSVVPFPNVDVRPTWLPEGWDIDLLELNLRMRATHNCEPVNYYTLGVTTPHQTTGCDRMLARPHIVAVANWSPQAALIGYTALTYAISWSLWDVGRSARSGRCSQERCCSYLGGSDRLAC